MAATAIWGIRRGSTSATPAREFHWLEASNGLWEAKWELALPGLAFAALFSGLATPVESAAVIGVVRISCRGGHPSRPENHPRCTQSDGRMRLLIGGVLLILGVSLGFTNYLVDTEVPTRAVRVDNSHDSLSSALLAALECFSAWLSAA